jgi:hypothetical protein
MPSMHTRASSRSADFPRVAVGVVVVGGYKARRAGEQHDMHTTWFEMRRIGADFLRVSG